MRLSLLAVGLGFLLDLLFGDPRWLYHPVRIIGKGITLFEKILRGIFPKSKMGERIAGILLVIFIVIFSAGIPFVILSLAYGYQVWLGTAIEAFMCYQLLATRSLKDESKKVYDALKKGDIVKSRRAVSMIVGRDTQELDEQGVTKAAVETVAENTSDGIIAPLLYMVIGGAVLGFAYKAINTMDSMVGYKNDKYRYFGTAAARLDDVVNYIPARLAAWIMILAAYTNGMNGKQAMKIYRRDKNKHASPNSAHTEAVMAGALEIQLAGDAWYFGKLHKKKFIGDPIRPVEIEDILRSHELMYATAVLAFLIFGTIRTLIEMAGFFFG
ncbi:MAG: cobalamin biosynthesis protein CobD [Clostridia bacterium]|nr:cobalamin biosynthesis protein CobD [Clostridia bacterium]NCC44616.1 cobalamin biosynthesis protein CobD [Clostridia bacterium]